VLIADLLALVVHPRLSVAFRAAPSAANVTSAAAATSLGETVGWIATNGSGT
jgi:hypothetical protein